jgi:hypothetical protein
MTDLLGQMANREQCRDCPLVDEVRRVNAHRLAEMNHLEQLRAEVAQNESRRVNDVGVLVREFARVDEHLLEMQRSIDLVAGAVKRMETILGHNGSGAE